MALCGRDRNSAVRVSPSGAADAFHVPEGDEADGRGRLRVCLLLLLLLLLGARGFGRDVEQRVCAEAVGAVDADTGGLAGGVEARDVFSSPSVVTSRTSPFQLVGMPPMQ